MKGVYHCRIPKKDVCEWTEVSAGSRGRSIILPYYRISIQVLGWHIVYDETVYLLLMHTHTRLAVCRWMPHILMRKT